MFERFTATARTAVVRAQEHARELQHTEIGAHDVLLGVLDDADGIPARVLHDLGVDNPAAGSAEESTFDPTDTEALDSIGIDLDAVRRKAEETFGPGALDRRRRQRPGLFGRRGGGGFLPFSTEAKTSLELALRAAAAEHHGYLGLEHLFLGLLATEQGTTLGVLRQLGVTEDPAGLRRRVLAAIDRAA